MKRLTKFFLQGVLITFPIAITAWLFYALTNWLMGLFPDILPWYAWFGIAFGLIFIVGGLSSTILFRPVIRWIEDLIKTLPVVNIVFTALKDFFSAFISDKKKFSQPVLVKMKKQTDVWRMGFLTQDDLTSLGLKDKVAVYVPHSYQISGNLFFVPTENVHPIKNLGGSEAMKFIISGGVADLEFKIKPAEEHEEED